MMPKAGYKPPQKRKELGIKRAGRIAVEVLITFARSERTHLTAREIEKVEEFMRRYGTDHPDPETRHSCRRIGARALLRMMEQTEPPPQLRRRAEVALMEIALWG